MEAFRKLAKNKDGDGILGIGGGPPTFKIEFERPAGSCIEVALRIKFFLVKNAQPLPVQWLVEESGGVFRRPGSGSWYGERGGDQRLFVVRLKIPGRPGVRQQTCISVQYAVAPRTVTDLR